MEDEWNKRRRNKCDTCTELFATCKGNPIFGTSKTKDNVYKCDKYKKKETR